MVRRGHALGVQAFIGELVVEVLGELLFGVVSAAIGFALGSIVYVIVSVSGSSAVESAGASTIRDGRQSSSPVGETPRSIESDRTETAPVGRAAETVSRASAGTVVGFRSRG